MRFAVAVSGTRQQRFSSGHFPGLLDSGQFLLELPRFAHAIFRSLASNPEIGG